MIAFVSGFGGASVSRISSFNGALVSTRAAPVSKTRFSMKTSPSVPFLDRPDKLDGSMPGDVGFDPLGFSNKFDLKFLREAELKHCMFGFDIRMNPSEMLCLHLLLFYMLCFYIRFLTSVLYCLCLWMRLFFFDCVF